MNKKHEHDNNKSVKKKSFQSDNECGFGDSST